MSQSPSPSRKIVAHALVRGQHRGACHFALRLHASGRVSMGTAKDAQFVRVDAVPFAAIKQGCQIPQACVQALSYKGFEQ